MSATERTAHRREPAATNLDQPQLSVVAIFVTGPGTVQRAGEAPRRETAPPQQIAWTAEQQAEYQAILTQVRDRFAQPGRNRFLARDGRAGVLPLTAA
ncbi:hypothetical protein [Streptomyces sp. URMC 129]|uniref:hypothetical protein n=1 Tax=Streptomyces sp. URMC 129 TaxID=3423407 RepID=UPI003F19CF9F